MELLRTILAAIDDFMKSGPGLPATLAYLTIAAVPVTLLHELGHAVVAMRRLREPVLVSVGSTGQLLRARVGRLTMTVNALGNPAQPGGFAAFDAARASARDIILIALAGPIASLLGAAIAAVAYSAAPTTGPWHDLLWALTFSGVGSVILNVVPFEIEQRRGGLRLRTDGRLALDAARAVRSMPPPQKSGRPTAPTSEVG
jgi:hypothetical protein